MARKAEVTDIGLREEDGTALRLALHADGVQELELVPGQVALDNLRDLLGPERFAEAGLKSSYTVARFTPGSKLLETFPLTTKPGSEYAFQPKHGVGMIAFEDQAPLADYADDRPFLLSKLPTGFVRTPMEGLGLVYPLRFILDVLMEVPDIEGIIICKDATLSRTGNLIRLPYKTFDEVRRAINRAHNQALDFAGEDKVAYLRGQLLEPLFPDEPVERSFRVDTAELRRRVGKALEAPGRRKEALRNSSAAVRFVRASAKELAAESASELYELNRDIELITLEKLIDIFEKKLGEDRKEAHWQAFLSGNPFILRLCFGIPISVVGEQVSVGGAKFSGSGDKLADYIVKSGVTGNISIIEIKKPGSALLQKKTYRGNLYAPSTELAGAMNQVLDQRFQLQTEINDKKVKSRIYDIFTYAVQGLVIAGIAPEDEDRRKSFELFRNSSKDITIITFDELLTKLKSLYAFLHSNVTDLTLKPVLLGDDYKDESDPYPYDEDMDLESDEDV